MKPAELFELAAIPLLTSAVWLAAGEFPVQIGAGRLLLAMSALLLLQSLIRDLWLLRSSRPAEAPRSLPCLCAESGVGMLGIIAGAVAVLAGVQLDFQMSPGIWTAAVAATTGVGFAIKDLVVEFSPLRVRRDPDHVNIIVSRRKPG
jgi:hypothetical protein